MANEINRIGINTGSVNNNNNPPKNEVKHEEKAPETKQQEAPAKPQMSADDVYAYMAQTAVNYNPSVQKTYDVSRYVTPEQAERIAGFVAGFEEEVARGLAAIEEEGLNLPEDQKYEIAASMVTA